VNGEIEKRLQKLLYAHRELKIAMRGHQGEYKLRFGEFGVMASILEAARSEGKPLTDTGIPMKTLSGDRNCTPAMITKLITGLEEQGYVRRELSTDDRRGIKVCVTPKGFEVWESDHMKYHSFIEKIGEKMGMERFLTVLELTEEFWKSCKEVMDETLTQSKESNNG
jgi:DNA-binding MarR family transcriptional regulator